MKNINKKNIEILFIFVAALTPLLWFIETNSLILGHDSGFRIKYVQYLVDLFYSWNPDNSFGQDLTVNKGFLVTQFPETFFSWITGSLRTGEMLTFVFWFFIIGIAMYIFIHSFFPDKKYWIFRLFGSTFYMFNFFLLQGWFIAERAKFSLFAALPLGLLVLYKTLTREYSLVKGAVLFALIFFFLNGGSSPPLYGSVLLVYALTLLYFTVLLIFQKQFGNILYYLKVVLVFSFTTALLNAYWVLPQLYLVSSSYATSLSSQGGIEGILGWESVVSKYASLINILRLQGIPDWYENPNHAYANTFLTDWLLIIASFLPLLIILFGFYNYTKFDKKIRKDQLFYLIAIIFIVAVVFTAGSHPPFGFLYTLLIKYVPGFAIFRSAFYKFGPAMWFSAIFLSGYFLNMFISTYIRNARIAAGVGMAAVALVLLYHFPYFQGKFFNWNDPFTNKVTVPEYVLEMSGYINTETPQASRILLMPALDSDSPSADSYRWGYWSLDLLPLVSVNRSVIANTGNAPGIVRELYDAVLDNNIGLFRYGSGIVGADKILWRGDVLYNNKITTSDSLRSEYGSFLESYKDAALKESGEWVLYDNERALPLFYTPTAITYSYTNVPVLYSLDSLQSPSRPMHVQLDGVNDEVRRLLQQDAMTEVVSARCVLCDENLLWNLQRDKYIPPARIAPGSLFYPFKAEREQAAFRLVEDSPENRIDTDLSMATTRLTELWSLSRKGNASEQEDNMIAVIERYKKHMNDAVGQVRFLPVSKQNDYRIRLLHFFQMHFNYLGTIEDRENIPEIAFSQLLGYIRKATASIAGDTWMTVANNRKRYLFEISNEGIYDVHIRNVARQPEAIFLDGKAIDKSSLRLAAGQHTVELRQPPSENLIIGMESQRAEYSLGFGEAEEFGMRNFQRHDDYIIEFDYTVLRGKNPYFAIDQFDKNGREIKVEHAPVFQLDVINRRFYYAFSPHPAAEDVRFRFFTDASIDELSDFAVANFSVTTKNNPEIILTRSINGEMPAPPTIKYERQNPTKYVIKITGAKSPYYLLFNQSFSNGWRLTSDKSAPGAIHFTANGFANAWRIDRAGDYTLTLEYTPQRYVYVGLVITFLTILFCLSILFLTRKK